MQKPLSLDKNNEWKEIEQLLSPASKIEERYLKSLKLIE